MCRINDATTVGEMRGGEHDSMVAEDAYSLGSRRQKGNISVVKSSGDLCPPILDYTKASGSRTLCYESQAKIHCTV